MLVMLKTFGVSVLTWSLCAVADDFCADKRRHGLVAAPPAWPGNVACRGYYNCWHGDEPMLMCAEQQMFDPAIKNCQWAASLSWQCGSSTTIAPTTTNALQSTGVTTALPWSSTTAAGTWRSTTFTSPAFFCADRQGQGLLAAPAHWPGNVDCRGYFNCWEGNEPLSLCAEGTMFDPETLNCQWTSSLDWGCGSSPSPTSTSALPSTSATETTVASTSTAGRESSTISCTVRTSSAFSSTFTATGMTFSTSTTAFLGTTTTTTFASACPVPGVASVVTAEVQEFLARAVVKRGQPHIDLDNLPSNEPNVQRIMRLLPKPEFDFLFPRANKGGGPDSDGPYSYVNFLRAAWQFPYFCNEAGQTDTNCKQEMVAMFANFAQEVGEHNPNMAEIPMWRQGLYHYEELCAPDCIYRDRCDDGSWQSNKWPCPRGVSYYGRGAKQLTHNYNYGPFSTSMFGDSTVLLTDPDRIIRDGWLAFASAFWFYMTPQPPKPSMHDVVTGRWQPNDHDVASGRLPGFDVLIMIINGAQECSNGDHQWASNRIEFFKEFSEHFDLPVGEHLGCGAMPPFDNEGSGLRMMYWAKHTRGGCELQEFVSPCSLLDSPYDLPSSYCMCAVCENKAPVICPPPEPVTSCNTCGKCVSNPCHEQADADTDGHCAACANGSQSWWPCDVPELCTCGA